MHTETSRRRSTRRRYTEKKTQRKKQKQKQKQRQKQNMRLAERSVQFYCTLFILFIQNSARSPFRIDQGRVPKHLYSPLVVFLSRPVPHCASFGASRLHRRRFLERPRAGSPICHSFFRIDSHTTEQCCTGCTRRARRTRKTRRGWLNKPGPGLVLFFDLSYRTLAAGNPICRYTHTTSSHCTRKHATRGHTANVHI